jgi:hypothetical protein
MDSDPFSFSGADADFASDVGVSDLCASDLPNDELFGMPKLPSLDTWSFGAAVPSSSMFCDMLSSLSTAIDDVDVHLDVFSPFGSALDLDDPINAAGQRKKRSPNLLPYQFGKPEKSNWYARFLAMALCRLVFEKNDGEKAPIHRAFALTNCSSWLKNSQSAEFSTLVSEFSSMESSQRLPTVRFTSGGVMAGAGRREKVSS